jgi:hypothetical protein
MGEWQDAADIDTETGTLKVAAYARDRAGNPPFLCIQTDTESGFASMTLEQAEAFAVRITELARGMRDNCRS